MSRWKWIVPAVAAIVMMAVMVPGTEAGIKWIGIDPEFKVNDHKFNVWVEWPEGYSCSIVDPIQVEVHVPKNASYSFMAESSQDVGNCGWPQATETSVHFSNKSAKHVKILTSVGVQEDFPVRVKVYLDDELVRTYEGSSLEFVTGKPIKLSEITGPLGGAKGLLKGDHHDNGKGNG